MFTLSRTRLSIIVFVLLLAACGGGGGGGSSAGSTTTFCIATPGTVAWDVIGCETQNQRGAVNGIDVPSIVTQATINSGLATLGITDPSMQAVYDVTTVRLWYSTIDTGGNIVLASGLLAMPNKPAGARAPLLGLQHGTILLNSLAPSQSTTGYDTQIGIAMASYGYIVAMTDYLGYGTTNVSSGPTWNGRMIHPYHHAASLTSATVDMLRASRTFLRDFNSPNIDPLLTGSPVHNGQLFLTGYSEGGYATLATQREIETNLGGEFNLIATEPAAGSYDMTSTVQAMASAPALPTPAQVNAGFLMKAYDSVYYSSTSRLGEIFATAPVNYASRVNTLYDGTNNEATIASQITTVTADLFNSTFLANFNGGGETTLKGQIAANNVYNWRPSRPTRLFHGDQDDVVPYANTTTAATVMATNGSVSITVAACSGVAPRNHVNCFPAFFVDMKSYFGGLALNL